MATSERAADRGKSKAIGALRAIGSDIRLARRSRGLSLEVVARELKLSAAELSRIERAQVEGASLVVLGQLCAVVGLDLAARTYPGGSPIRDARHGRLLMRLHHGIHPGLGWALEVPFPNPGDPRAWDALIKGEDWRYGVEAELNPIDGQALIQDQPKATRWDGRWSDPVATRNASGPGVSS